ncbi:AraC family transcriptional regulator [Paraburkholderia sp. BL6669N2]|uniref:helix-turn-helix domain-containing protein n=1 Tax=Paraburkholderia sp. BL6669N2 TaxID=1938807 RepID=UPI000E362888|nr:AraC family transcriptional regulator [Paraburkholderia sp. BL6669N2]REG49605.1 AraC family transcriptional regulator [Paraburkholderia sp. BL6669N2]
MAEPGAYGESIRQAFRLMKSPSILTSLRPGAAVAVTRVTCGPEGIGKTLPLPVEAALMVNVQFQPLIHELWIAGKPVPVHPWPSAALSVVDLEQESCAFFGGALDCMQFYFPRKSLAAMADENEERAINDFVIPNGTVDIITYQLAKLMIPALEHPEQANQLFLSGLLHAFYWHLAATYGNMGIRNRGKGGLTAWQLAAAKELISENLSGDVSLAFIARECGLSPTHFARAFRESVGIPPHQWLLLRRVDVAKHLLRLGNMGVAEIALATGFADQSHLTRVFSRLVGITPNAWRVLRPH